MQNSKLGVLIHGPGWVSTQHIAAYRNNPFTKVVAISGRTLGSARSRAEEFGLDVPVFDNYEKALMVPDLDIVSVCTPQHLHAGNVILAAQAQKHIVIEKPAAQTPDELKHMRAAVEKAQVKTVVSFVLRWNPLFQMLKRMTRDDTFGEIYCVETDYQSYFGDWWGGFAVGRTIAMGGSAFLTAGCHAIDALRWFAGDDEYSPAQPVEVFAYQGGKRGQATRQYNPLTNDWHESDPLEFPGLEMALVKFSNGVLGKVSANYECIQPYAFPIEIFGDKGTVKNNKIWSHKYPGQKDWIELPTICPDSPSVSHHPFQGEIDHFIDCIRNDQESHCNLDDAAKTHEIVFGAYESYRTGQPVKLSMESES